MRRTTMIRPGHVLFLLIPGVITLALLVSSHPFAAPRATAGGIQGDVDCNSVVDTVDGLFTLRFTAALEPFANCIASAADTNCDDSIEAVDALGILRHVAALPPLPAPGDCPPIGTGLATATPVPTDTPTPSPTATTPPNSTATPTPTPAPSPVSATPTVTPTPTAAPTATPQPTPITYTLAETAIGLNAPELLDMAFVPGSDDEAVVATQTGQLWRVSLSGAFAPVEFGDITDRMTRVSDEGLLGMTFAPGDPATIYLNYTTGGAGQYWGAFNPGCEVPEWAPLPHDDPKRSRVSRFSVADDALVPGSEEIILEVPQPHCHHNVSDLVFGPDDGYLYVGVGDGGGQGGPYLGLPEGHGLLGTILRIDVSGGGTGYTVPADNPFVDDTGPNGAEVWAYGLRHPWRFSFEAASGDLWAGDVGQTHWEEVDRIVRGRNYGWNTIEGNHCFMPPQGCALPPNYVPPHTVYSHVPDNVAVIGGFVYRGQEMPELHGHFIFGDLLRPRVFAISTSVSGDPIELYEREEPCICLTAFAETPEGEILAVTSPRNGGPGAILKLAHDN